MRSILFRGSRIQERELINSAVPAIKRRDIPGMARYLGQDVVPTQRAAFALGAYVNKYGFADISGIIAAVPKANEYFFSKTSRENLLNLFDIGVSWEGKANDLIRFKGRGSLMIFYNARDEETGELCRDDNGKPETNGIQTKDYYIRDLFTLSPVIVIKDYLSFGEIKPREILLSELQEVPENMVGVEWHAL